MASGAFAAAVPQGWTQGTRPASSSAMILSVISLIKARPVLAGTGASGVSGHRGSPRRAPRASLATSNPSRKTRPHSNSRGVAGCPRRRGCAGDLGAGQGEGVPQPRRVRDQRSAPAKGHRIGKWVQGAVGIEASLRVTPWKIMHCVVTRVRNFLPVAVWWRATTGIDLAKQTARGGSKK